MELTGPIHVPTRRQHPHSSIQRASFDTLEPRRLMNAGYVLDFEHDAGGAPLPAGTLVAEQWAAWGAHITTNVVDQDHPAMIFDSAHPTGDDADLGSPNRGFRVQPGSETRGPGEGWGGAPTDPGNPALPNAYANSTPLHNLLIVAQSADTTATDGPNDWDGGGQLIIDFDADVTIESLDVLDIDDYEGTPLPGNPTPAHVSVVEVFDVSGALIASVPLVGAGDNSLQQVLINRAGIRRLVVSFRGEVHGSGAIDNVRYSIDPISVPQTALGDRIWYDRDGDGQQDPSEEGLAGVKVRLFAAGDDGLAGTSDDIFTGQTARSSATGRFLFSDLPFGAYFARFTAPAGFTFTKLRASGISKVADLRPGDVNRTLDAGLIKGLSLFRSSRYKPTDSLEQTFGVDVPGVGPAFTLLQALNTAGNSYKSMNRQAVMALLKASKTPTQYRYSTRQIIALTRHSYSANAFSAVKDLFAAENA